MKGYLIDSNIISELRKNPSDETVRTNMSLVPPNESYLSALSFAEVRRGIEKIRLRDLFTAAVLDEWIRSLYKQYEGRILEVNMEIAEEAGRMCPRQPLPMVDSLLAATAKVHDLCVVTRNTADFARSGVPYLNPFESPFQIHN